MSRKRVREDKEPVSSKMKELVKSITAFVNEQDQLNSKLCIWESLLHESTFTLKDGQLTVTISDDESLKELFSYFHTQNVSFPRMFLNRGGVQKSAAKLLFFWSLFDYRWPISSLEWHDDDDRTTDMARFISPDNAQIAQQIRHAIHVDRKIQLGLGLKRATFWRMGDFLFESILSGDITARCTSEPREDCQLYVETDPAMQIFTCLYGPADLCACCGESGISHNWTLTSFLLSLCGDFQEYTVHSNKKVSEETHFSRHKWIPPSIDRCTAVLKLLRRRAKPGPVDILVFKNLLIAKKLSGQERHTILHKLLSHPTSQSVFVESIIRAGVSERVFVSALVFEHDRHYFQFVKNPANWFCVIQTMSVPLHTNPHRFMPCSCHFLNDQSFRNITKGKNEHDRHMLRTMDKSLSIVEPKHWHESHSFLFRRNLIIPPSYLLLPGLTGDDVHAWSLGDKPPLLEKEGFLTAFTGLFTLLLSHNFGPKTITNCLALNFAPFLPGFLNLISDKTNLLAPFLYKIFPLNKSIVGLILALAEFSLDYALSIWSAQVDQLLARRNPRLPLTTWLSSSLDAPVAELQRLWRAQQHT